MYVLKFIYSEKATNFCEISTVDFSYVVTFKSTGEISQNFVAFSEHMNFKKDIGKTDSIIDIKKNAISYLDGLVMALVWLDGYFGRIEQK